MRLVRYEPGGDRSLVSKDGRSTYVAASFPTNGGGVLRPGAAEARGDPGVTIGGNDIARDQVGDQVSKDIARAELLAFPILFLLSLFVFRSVVAALLPLAVGGATILLSFLAMRFVNAQIEPMSIYALNLITGLGLGLAIDYSLFMVWRFREELERGRRPRRGAARDDDHRGADGAVLAVHGRGGARRRCWCSRCASSTRWASAGCSAR